MLRFQNVAITDEDIAKITGLIPALAAALRPPPPMLGTTLTLPNGEVISLADYQDTDILFDVDADGVAVAVSPLKATLAPCPSTGGWFWGGSNSSWRSWPTLIALRISCVAPTAVVTLTYRTTPHVFTGADMPYGRRLARPIVMQERLSWKLTADRPTRVVIGGLLLPEIR